MKQEHHAKLEAERTRRVQMKEELERRAKAVRSSTPLRNAAKFNEIP